MVYADLKGKKKSTSGITMKIEEAPTSPPLSAATTCKGSCSTLADCFQIEGNLYRVSRTRIELYSFAGKGKRENRPANLFFLS